MDGNQDPLAVSALTITQAVTLKLKEGNYLIWKLQFEQFLSNQTLLGYVTGALPRPAPTLTVLNGEEETQAVNPEFNKWIQKDQLILAWLYGTLSEDALKSVYGLHTSQDVWLALAKKYNRVSATRKLDLQRRVQTTVKGNKTMGVYLSEIKYLCDQLDSIGAPITEHEKIYGVLNGLGKEYEAVCTVIEHSMDVYPGPCFEDVVHKLTGFEDKLKTYEQVLETYEQVPDVSSHEAYYTNHGGYSGRGRGQNRGGYRGRGSYTTQGRGFPQQFGHPASRSSGLSDQRPTCQICGKYGHPAYKCYRRFDEHFAINSPSPQANFLTTSQHNRAPGAEWYPDSGASHHITSSVHLLDNAQEYDGDGQVMVGNGDFLPITHVGSASIPTGSGKIPLLDVLICPKITKSLLSVSKLTDDYPCEFTFDATTVCIKDKQTNKVLSQGSKNKGLYRFNDSQFQAFYSSRQHIASDRVWHMRLGHPNDQVLKHLSTIKVISFNKLSQFLCEACQVGKTSKLPFSSSVFRSSRVLERIHCDVWGPAPVVSVQGFRFYVVFIDNYSRFCWFYPLKSKSDVFAIFKAFQLQVENQYNQKIAIFQSDGGGEFINKSLTDHFAATEIKQIVSRPHTPEQNGIAERRHRHITEIGLSMLYQSHMPYTL